MKNADALSRRHPLVCFVYFALVLAFSALFLHPLSLAISLVCALWYALCLNGRRALRQMAYILPAALFAAAVNVLFNHAGVTVLGYLPSGNPLTLESLAYGGAAAAMLAAVLLWFSCCTRVLTSDKLTLLLGRIAPYLSLLLAMILRFVPLLARRFRAAAEAQRCAGRLEEGSGFRARVRNSAAVFSAVLSWTLEGAADTADSMRARGYGLSGRTAFSPARFTLPDAAALAWMAFCAAVLLIAAAAGRLSWRYYPALAGELPIPCAAAFAALCLTPILLNGWEVWLWKRSASKI